MYTLDGEELYYADFTNKRGVYPQPDFIDHMSYGEGIFQAAQTNLEVCKQNLKVLQQAHKDIPRQLGKTNITLRYSGSFIGI